MLNNICIAGRITKDIELRQTTSGTSVVVFTIACERDYAGKDGGNKETDFVDVVAYRSTAEFISKYFSKGRMAVVSGRLQVRKWKTKDGENRYATEVIAENVYFGDSKRDNAGDAAKAAEPAVAADDDYGDIPF